MCARFWGFELQSVVAFPGAPGGVDRRRERVLNRYYDMRNSLTDVPQKLTPSSSSLTLCGCPNNTKTDPTSHLLYNSRNKIRVHLDALCRHFCFYLTWKKQYDSRCDLCEKKTTDPPSSGSFFSSPKTDRSKEDWPFKKQHKMSQKLLPRGLILEDFPFYRTGGQRMAQPMKWPAEDWPLVRQL